ncbi:MAG: hypothetical protein NBV57_01150 [Algoriphagus sp.]|nr:hypothetical protein [Algoriphagus sp.]
MRILLFLFLALVALPSAAQLQFKERVEVPTQAYDPIFELMRIPNGLVAFRTNQPRSLDEDRVFEYFLASDQLQSQGLVEVKMRKGFDMIGYDTDGNNLYVLFAKGETSSSEKYVLHLDLITRVGVEYTADNLLSLDLVEFLVLDQKAIFMGLSDNRPAVQIFSLEDKTVQTVQGIYGNETHVVQMLKLPEMEALEVVIRRRGPFKSQETLVLTFDLQGNLLRELKLDPLGGPEEEPVDGLLLAGGGYGQTLIGAFGKELRNSYKGMYLVQINEFGEQNIGLYTLADFPNFYTYLPEKLRLKQEKIVAEQLKKEKTPSIRNSYAIRDVKEFEDRYLIYFDQFSVSSSRGAGTVAPSLASQRYRYNRASRMGYIPYYMDPYNSLTGPVQTYTLVTEYTYRSAHFIEVAKSGQVLWDNSARYEDVDTTYPEPFAEISVHGDDVFHLFLINDQIKLNYFRKGEKLLENLSFQLELDPAQGEIHYTDLESLRLLHWYGPYFLVSGIQKIRSTDAAGNEGVREVFFIHKLLLDGDLYIPNEDAD